MKTFFRGNKYSFEVIYQKFNRNEYSWTLRAICRETNRYSGINNLNPVLSQLGISEVSRRFEDSFEWGVSKVEVKRFNKTVKEFLKCRSFLKYLEHRLDEDRNLGEWENVRE